MKRALIDVFGLRGDVSGLRGNVDDCELMDAERIAGINIPPAETGKVGV